MGQVKRISHMYTFLHPPTAVSASSFSQGFCKGLENCLTEQDDPAYSNGGQRKVCPCDTQSLECGKTIGVTRLPGWDVVLC